MTYDKEGFARKVYIKLNNKKASAISVGALLWMESFTNSDKFNFDFVGLLGFCELLRIGFGCDRCH